MTDPLGPPPAYTPIAGMTAYGDDSAAAADAAARLRLGIRTDKLMLAAQREYEMTQNPDNWGTRQTHRHFRGSAEPEQENESWLLRIIRLMAPTVSMPNSSIGLLYI